MKRFIVSCAIVLVVFAPGVAAEDAEKGGGPDVRIGVEGLTYAEEGGSIRMTAPPGSDFFWQKDGSAMVGETSSVLLLSPTVPSDSGSYWRRQRRMFRDASLLARLVPAFQVIAYLVRLHRVGIENLADRTLHQLAQPSPQRAITPRRMLTASWPVALLTVSRNRSISPNSRDNSRPFSDSGSSHTPWLSERA